MLRTSLLAGLLTVGLTIPAFPQDDNGDEATNGNQNQEQQEQQDQDQQEQQVEEASLEEGQSIRLPAGAELLELTVAVPETLRSGQRYRYRARVRNISENTMLTDVRLVQINGDQFEIESSETRSEGDSRGGNGNNENGDSKDEDETQNGNNGNGNNETTWQWDQIAPGEAKELVVTAIAGDTGDAEHCFAVKYQESLCAKVEVVKPEVEITKAGPEQVSVCEIFEYRYELTNTGTGMAEDITVRDELPEGLKTKSGDDTVEFRVEELEEGESKTYSAEVHSMEAGEYGSRAVAEQQAGDTHESKRVTTNVEAPELNVEIAGPRAIKSGEGGNFDVTVTNTSDIIARDVVLTVDPGENMDVISAGNGDARNGGESYRYDLGDLEPEDERTVSLSADSDEAGNVSINAQAASLCALDEDQEAVAVAESEANMQSRVLKITSLLLSVVDTDDVIATGKEITYRINVRNQGEHADENVKVALELPAGLSFKEADGPTSAEAEGRRIRLGTVEKIEPGETLEWQVTAEAESAGEKVVEATLDSEGLQNTVNAEEVSTFYDSATQRTEASDEGSSDAEESDEEEDAEGESDDSNDN